MPEKNKPQPMTPPATTEDEITPERATIMVGASAAYACIKGKTFTMDVQLDSGCSAETSLARSAAELRQKAEDSIKRAKRIEAAIPLVKEANSRSRWARASAAAQ